MSKSKQRREAEQQEKIQKRRDLEVELGLHPGRLNPRPVPRLGKYSFTSRREFTQYENSLLFRKKPDPPA